MRRESEEIMDSVGNRDAPACIKKKYEEFTIRNKCLLPCHPKVCQFDRPRAVHKAVPTGYIPVNMIKGT